MNMTRTYNFGASDLTITASGACQISTIVQFAPKRIERGPLAGEHRTWAWDRDRVMPDGSLEEHPFASGFMEIADATVWERGPDA